MKVFTYFILSLIIFSHTSESINVIHLDQHIPLERLKKDPQVQISITESLLQPTQDTNATKNLEFFVLKSASRHKNKAYLRILKNYQKLVNTLIQKLIIGDERLFIKSKIKQKYLKKKKLWEFGIMFMMQGQEAELEECYHDIVKLGVTKMSSRPYTSAMNEGIIASNAFYKLKQKIWKELEMVPGKTIKKVSRVEIRGLSIPNSINLQRKQMDVSTQEIKEEINEQFLYFMDFFFAKAEIAEESKSVTIKAVFEIGQQQEMNEQEIEAQSSQSQFESDSFENEDENDKNKQKNVLDIGDE